MWSEKDIASIYATMPEEQIIPMVATTIFIALVKVAAVAGGILLLKWIASKIKGK